MKKKLFTYIIMCEVRVLLASNKVNIYWNKLSETCTINKRHVYFEYIISAKIQYRCKE